MRFRLPSFLVPVLLLVLSLTLSACSVGESTATPFTQPQPVVQPTVISTIAPTAAAKLAPTTAVAAAQPVAPAKPKEYLPAYGCLPAITVTDTVVQACMDKPEPTQYDTLMVTTRMSKDGLPIAGAPVKTTWNYKTSRPECSAVSNADGIGFCQRNIGDATLGFRVVVEVQFDYNGQGHRGETSFTPARPGVPPPTATAVPPAPTAIPAVQPAAKAPAQAPAGVKFTSVRGGSPGGYASVSVQTAPGANCSISYTTPHGTDSRAAGLVDKQANGAGVVSWSWKIGTNTYAGTGEVDVTCNGASASASITIN
jgi:hypothetical protein